MHDVARLAGVSIKTVSNVINDYPHVRDVTRNRVLDAIGKLDYRPNLAARGLRSGRTGFISLVIPAVRENYFAELAHAVIGQAERHGLWVMIEQTGGDRNAELQAVSGSGRPHFVDGILFNPVGLQPSDVSSFDRTVPMVLLGERIFGGPTDHVAIENISAARAAVRHLVQRGRRRIAVVGASLEGMEEVGSAGLRLQGYCQALEEDGIPLDPALVRPSAAWNREAGALAVTRMVEEGVDFDAVFTLNDTLGLGALRALASAGISVPQDVALIGFDNIDETRYSVPSMTTVDPGRSSIAVTAVDLLVERISGKGADTPPRTIRSTFEIIERESTGAAAPRMGWPATH